MTKLDWCISTKNGIELVEPSDILWKAYQGKAERSLHAVSNLKNNKEWAITSAYYAMYFSFYAILMKIGIKCEIHSCTVELMRSLFKEYFTKEQMELLKKAMNARVDILYYVDRIVQEEECKDILEKAPQFVVACKEIAFSIKEKEREHILETLKNMKQEKKRKA